MGRIALVGHAFTLAAVLVLAAALTPGALAVQARASAIAVSPDGARVWVVNPDSSTVSVIDTATDAVLDEISVGRQPRTLAINPAGTRVYVACMGENRVDVLDASTRALLHSIAVGREPFGVAVAPDGARAYVTNSASDTVSAIDTASDTVVQTVNAGDHPRGLAVSADSSTLVVTRFLTSTPSLNGTVQVFTASTLVSQGTANLGVIGATGVPNLIQFAAFRPATNVVWLPLVGSVTGNANLTLTTTVHPFVSIVDPVTRAEIPGGRTDLNNVVAVPAVSQPVAVDFTPSGAVALVVDMASNDVTLLNAGPRTEIKTLLVGDAPQGVAVNPAGTRAYVSNYLGRSVSVISLGPPVANAAVVATIGVVGVDPLPANVLNGKKFFFTSRGRLSNQNFVACISCHPDAGHDGRDWIFTNNVDEGVRVTTDIHGIMDSGAVHWTANMDELQDLEFNIRKLQFGAGLITGTPNDPFGPPNTGLSADLDDMAAFMDSLVPPVRGNPNRAPGGGLTPSAARGKLIFMDPQRQCASCHRGTATNDSDRTNIVRHDVGTLAAQDVNGADGFDTPTLKNLYDSPPYLHDGSAPALQGVLTVRNSNDEHGVTSDLAPAQVTDLVNYLLAIGTDRDELGAGQGTGLASSIRLPIRARDVTLTLLDTTDDKAHNRIYGYSLALTFPPAANVTAVTVAPAGLATGLAIASVTDPPADLGSGRKSYTVRFSSAIPLTMDQVAGGDIVAVATFTRAPGSLGTTAVGIDGTAASLIGGPGAAVEKSESTSDENLLVTGGSITIGTPEVSASALGATPLLVSRPTLTTLHLSWESVGPGVTYNVYRGTLNVLHTGTYDHACFGSGLAAPAVDVVAGTGDFYYLVSARTPAFGEGSLGAASSGAARPNGSPCP